MRDHGGMARFMLAVMPFTGHVAPLLAVAEILTARGHDVRIYTGTRFRTRVEGVGARFVPWREAPDFDENDLAATFPRLRGARGVRQLLFNVQDAFIGTAPGQVTDLAAEWRREPWEVTVGDEMSVGTALFAELSGVPWATVAVLPLTLPSRQGPPSGLGLQPGTTPITRMRDATLRATAPLMMRALHAPLARARAAVELPPSRTPFDVALYSRQLILASGAPLLDLGRTDRPPWLHFVGTLTPPAVTDAELPPWWGDLADRRIVHVTQGTHNIDPDDLIRPALEALAGEDVLVVVSTGIRGRDELPFPVPANTRVAGFLPYSALLPRVDVMITNGGWGGVLGTLAYGIPLIVAGGDIDKPEVAARVAWSGSGINLRTGTPSAAQIADAFQQISADSSYRAAAQRIADELGKAGGATRAAELLEGMR